MQRPRRSALNRREGQRGQILVVAVLAMIAMIGGVARGGDVDGCRDGQRDVLSVRFEWARLF